MRARSKKQYASSTTRDAAGDLAGTSASTSRKRRRGNEGKTATTDEENDKQQQNNNCGLPDELWEKILRSLDDDSVTAFACVSKQLRRVQQTSGRRLKTDLQQYEDDNNIYYSFCLYETGKFSAVSEAWCH